MACSLAFALCLFGGSAALAQRPTSIDPAFRSTQATTQKVAAPAIPPLPARPTGKIQLVQAAEPMPEPGSIDELKQYQILLEPPSPEALFGRRDSEKMFEQRMRQQAKQMVPPSMVQFPDKPVLSKTEYQGRSFPEQTIVAEPRFVCHHRLFFEEKNAERYGWGLGFIQPFVSTLYFYRDVIFLPHNFWSHPCRRYECNAGYCLPGDPVPYIIYPPDITVTGSLAEGAVAVGLFAAIP
jgi:hypothetical protein